MFSREGHSLIEKVADPIYSELSRFHTAPSEFLGSKYPHTPVWRQDLCRGWTKRALAIVALEVELSDQRVDITTTIVKEPNYHHYVSIDAGRDEPYVLDGTWQQFLDPSSIVDSLPRVLAGRPTEITPVLQAAGIDEKLIRIWQPRQNAEFTDTEIYWRRRT